MNKGKIKLIAFSTLCLLVVTGLISFIFKGYEDEKTRTYTKRTFAEESSAAPSQKMEASHSSIMMPQESAQAATEASEAAGPIISSSFISETPTEAISGQTEASTVKTEPITTQETTQKAPLETITLPFIPEEDLFKVPDTGAKAVLEDGYAGIYVFEGSYHWIKPFSDCKPDIERSNNYSITFKGTKYHNLITDYSITFRLVHPPTYGLGPTDFEDYPSKYKDVYRDNGWRIDRVSHYEPKFLQKFFGAYRDEIGYKMDFGACLTNFVKDGETLYREAYYSVYDNSDGMYEVIVYIRASFDTLAKLRAGIFPFESKDDLLYHWFVKAYEKYPEVEYPVGRYFLTDYWPLGRKEKNP